MQRRRGSATVSDGFRDHPRLPGRQELPSSECWPYALEMFPSNKVTPGEKQRIN